MKIIPYKSTLISTTKKVKLKGNLFSLHKWDYNNLSD